MTTGEKLYELRKKKGITQDGLAEILNVSRQSVSKWESDLAFPETLKLIELAKLYDVSVDYLLNTDNNEKKNEEAEEKEKTVFNFNDIMKKKSFFNSCFIIGASLISLLFYLFNVIKIEINQSFLSGFITVNVYELAFSSSYGFGNLLFTILVLESFALLIMGCCNLYYSSKKITKIVFWIMLTQIIFSLAIVIIFFNAALIGLYIIIIYFIIQCVLFKFLPQNKF